MVGCDSDSAQTDILQHVFATSDTKVVCIPADMVEDLPRRDKMCPPVENIDAIRLLLNEAEAEFNAALSLLTMRNNVV